jgi:hypothetical protein
MLRCGFINPKQRREMPMNVVIKVRKEIAVPNLDKLHPQNEEALELSKAAEELGVELRQMHPSVKDSVLASYYVVEVSDSREAARVAERFRVCRAVEAAYVKPPDELP